MDAARRNPFFKTTEVLAPQCPPELAYLWEWFTRLSAKRQIGMAVNPLTSSEIISWQRRYRTHFEPFEEAVIDRLDSLFLQSHVKKATK